MPQSNSSSTSNILYPIDFSLEMKTYSNRSISESNENSTNYRQILTDMSIIKKKLMNIELRLNETMREVSKMPLVIIIDLIGPIGQISLCQCSFLDLLSSYVVF